MASPIDAVRLIRRLRYLQEKALRHEKAAAKVGHYKVAIMQRAAWDTLRKVMEEISKLRNETSNS